MGHTFECAGCHHIKTEAVPYYGSGLMCEACRRSLIPPSGTKVSSWRPPAPPAPPMRQPNASVVPSLGSLWIVLVFIAGVAVGAKMAGGW